MSLSRRRFMLASAGAVLASAQARAAWPIQIAASTAPPRWHPNADLLRHLPRLLELASVPGLALAVVDRGKVWKRGFGRAIEDPPRAVSDETIFEAASLGKPLFAYAVLRLADRGIIDLDRPLYDYFAIPEANNSRMRRVTARHVLSHTTGLPNWRNQPGPLQPTTDPGKAFSYSGEGIFYLQRVVEVVVDKPFARFMRQEVLDPLGMKQSSYVWLPEFESRMAAGYDGYEKRLDVQSAIGRRTLVIAQEWGKPLSEWRYEDSARAVQLVNPQWPILPIYMDPNAAGSLLTTITDYAKFLIPLVARPPAPGLDLLEATRHAMSTPQVRLNSALHWGLGWGIQRDEHGEVLWHWGANNSFRNFVIADPANDRAIVVLTNSENGPRIYERVIAAVTGHDHPAFLWI
ncbi:MAG TPA: serine hydrolase domain-containing protein [Gemmatimonadales bacterium]|nr:serine hydrolase domain-containing protein [Gemmatimonadales bacterium]